MHFFQKSEKKREKTQKNDLELLKNSYFTPLTFQRFRFPAISLALFSYIWYNDITKEKVPYEHLVHKNARAGGTAVLALEYYLFWRNLL